VTARAAAKDGTAPEEATDHPRNKGEAGAVGNVDDVVRVSKSEVSQDGAQDFSNIQRILRSHSGSSTNLVNMDSDDLFLTNSRGESKADVAESSSALKANREARLSFDMSFGSPQNNSLLDTVFPADFASACPSPWDIPAATHLSDLDPSAWAAVNSSANVSPTNSSDNTTIGGNTLLSALSYIPGTR